MDVVVEPVSDHDVDLEEDVLEPEDADGESSTQHKEQSEEPGHGKGQPGWDGEVEGHRLVGEPLLDIWALGVNAE